MEFTEENIVSQWNFFRFGKIQIKIYIFLKTEQKNVYKDKAPTGSNRVFKNGGWGQMRPDD